MYWKAQRTREAENEAKDILKRDSNDVPSRRLLGRIYLRSLGDMNAGSSQSETANKAIEQYREINRLDPTDTESALWLARLYRLKNEHDKSEQVLRGILKTDPDNEQAVEQLTQLLMDQGKSEEAVSLLEGITRHSSSPVLMDLLGDAYTQAHELAKAETAYRKAAETDPSELSHLRGLAQTLFSEEKYSEALKVYQKVSDLMPDDSDVYLRIAQIYRELHQLDKAEENLVKARQYAPGNLEVMYNEGMLYESQGRYEDAIRVLSDAVSGIKGQSTTMPSRRRMLSIFYQQLGQLYREDQNYQAAIYTFEELGHLGDEEDRRPRLMSMDTYRAAKDLPRALHTGQETLAKHPAHRAIRTSYSLLLGANGQTDDAGVRLDEAQSLVERALKEEPYNGGYLDSLGWIYFKENRTADAEAMLRKALARERHDPTIHAHLGDVYAKLGRPDLAAAEWEKSLAEWHRSLPAELETDKVAELERKLSQSKHRVAQKSSASDAKPY